MLKKLLTVATAVMILAGGAWAQRRSIDHPMTRAVLEAYTGMIKENPQDYEAYLQRAREYYNHDEYMPALADITEALKFIPAQNKELRFDAFFLRANIYIQTGHAQDALTDLNSALALDPSSFSTLYLKANTEYDLKQYGAAKSDYQRMLRINPRSTEAMLGLALVAVKENNIGLANDYLDQAVTVDSHNAKVYLRRAAVRQLMGNDNGAIDDLLLALSIDSTNPKAVDALLKYADTSYNAVISGLTSAIAQAPKNALYLYLRAQIAQAHNHYAPAVADYRKILAERLYNYNGIYASLAECELNMGQYQKAFDDINYALVQNTNNPAYYLIRSQVLRALGNNSKAIDDAARALAVKPGLTEALMQMARCYIDNKNYKAAADLLGEACLSVTDNPELLLLRASVLDKLNQPQAALLMRTNAAAISNFAPDDVRSLKGFALESVGDNSQAQAWIDNILSSGKDQDGLANYYGACFYAARGDNDRALQCAEESLRKGYANYYNWMLCTDSPVNIAPLRNDLRFLNLIERYGSLFKE